MLSKLSAAGLTLIAVSTGGCWNRRPQAWPAVPTQTSPSPNRGDFNVVWMDQDFNGFPKNPQWGAQRDKKKLPPVQNDQCVREPNLPGCTVQQTIIDKPIFPNSVICVPFIPASKIHGHVDWLVANYYGRLDWLNFADDFDYNLKLFPDQNAGLTRNNNPPPLDSTLKYIEIEFDSRETLDRFVTPTWKELSAAVETRDLSRIKHWLNRSSPESAPDGVVVGLFGLDCEHDCRSEVHPVYALAIEVDDRLDDNMWAIFVRNSGNGGYCGSLNHELFLPGGKIHVVIPNAGSIPPSVLAGSTEFAVTPNSGIAFPSVSYVPKEGLVFSFTMPEPDSRSLAELVIHLKWPNGSRTLKRRQARRMNTPNLLERTEQPQEEDAGEYFGSLLKREATEPLQLESKLASEMESNMAAEIRKDQIVQPPAEIPVAMYSQPERCAPDKANTCSLPVLRPTADNLKLQEDNYLFKLLCAEYKAKNKTLPTDRVPDLPKVCESLGED
jgi:hypothetical protein